MNNDHDVTELLIDLRKSPDRLMDRLLPLIYDDLHRLASKRLSRERSGHTLNPTGLVHEAYLRLADQTRLEFNDRGHFLAVAARAMRFILVDYARRHNAQKRGGSAIKQSLDNVDIAVVDRASDLMALDEALSRLGKLNNRLSTVVECRFFGGMTVEETAQALHTSSRTIKRDWMKARLWLHRELNSSD